jgi:uncharacterized protein (DUF3820 family)
MALCKIEAWDGVMGSLYMAKPIRQIIMPFGQMKGKRLGEVFEDPFYMEWMQRQYNPSRPMKYILKLYEEYLNEEQEYWDNQPNEEIVQRNGKLVKLIKKQLYFREGTSHEPGIQRGRYYIEEEYLCKYCNESIKCRGITGHPCIYIEKGECCKLVCHNKKLSDKCLEMRKVKEATKPSNPCPSEP